MVYVFGVLTFFFGICAGTAALISIIFFFIWISEKVKRSYVDGSNLVVSLIYTVILSLMAWGCFELTSVLYERAPVKEYEVEVLYFHGVRDTMNFSGKFSPTYTNCKLSCDGTIVKGVEDYRIISISEVKNQNMD